MQIKSAKDLIVYQKAYAPAMEIFVVSKGFPGEEKYSLIDRIRRSSRSVCTNLREAWAKWSYEAHFINNLTDADGENGETETWLDLAHDYGYLPKVGYAAFVEKRREIGATLGSILVIHLLFVPKPIADV